MNGKLLRRLEELERKILPKPLIVIAETPNGETVELPARECAERGYNFVCVKATGSQSMDDVDVILETILKQSDTLHNAPQDTKQAQGI